jgi:IS605 OrfB family transposase
MTRMETVRTIVCKLDPTPEQRLEMDATLEAFARACNHIADVTRREHTANKVKVHRACYAGVRKRFGLSANLAIRAIARVCAALKVKEKMHSAFASTSVDYDQRIFSFREWDWTFSLTLLHSRHRLNAALGERQKNALKSQKPTSATLVKRRDGTYFLHVQVKGTAPDPIKVTATLGIDLGQRRVAVDSDGNVHEATEVNRLRAHYAKVRRSVQAKGTKGARRLLKRLSGRERKHASHINHTISRRLVDLALHTGRAIALEDLTGIRQRTKCRKAQRYRKESWSFFQLRQFIAYKAQGAGVPVVLVNPAYASQRCHKCGVIGKRHGLIFSCTSHGDFDADHNAALNISLAGAGVTRPEHSDRPIGT